MSSRALRRAALAAAAVLLLGAGLPVRGAVPPAPDRWATDEAGFLSSGALRDLDRTLEAFEARTGRQVLVYIGTTTGGEPLEDWASQAFQAWRVGRRGLDDGLALFVMASDRRIRVEVGYGLEALVPDITAGRVVNDIMAPAIRAGDNDKALRDGVAALLSAVEGEAGAGDRAEASSARGRRLSAAEKLLVGAAVLFFLVLFITNPSLAFWLLINILSGGRGGGGGGGGSFRGGGGRSGGGGASGSW